MAKVHLLILLLLISLFILDYSEASFYKTRKLRKVVGGYMNVNKKKTNLKTKADSREKKRRKGFKEDIKLEKKPTKQKQNQNWRDLLDDDE